jgi:hypothetical protein
MLYRIRLDGTTYTGDQSRPHVARAREGSLNPGDVVVSLRPADIPDYRTAVLAKSEIRHA